jgi:hypothetical protein
MKSSLLINMNTADSGIDPGWDDGVRQADGVGATASVSDLASLDNNASNTDEQQAEEKSESLHRFLEYGYCRWWSGFAEFVNDRRGVEVNELKCRTGLMELKSRER